MQASDKVKKVIEVCDGFGLCTLAFQKLKPMTENYPEIIPSCQFLVILLFVVLGPCFISLVEKKGGDKTPLILNGIFSKLELDGNFLVSD